MADSVLGAAPSAAINPPSSAASLDCKSMLNSKDASNNIFNLSYIPSSNGTVTFSEDEISLVSSKWSNSLVGYAIGKRPYYELLLQTIRKNWNLKGQVDLFALAEGFFLFNFSCVEDMQSILAGGPCFILGRPFLLKRWTPDFIPVKEDFAEIPIWVKLPRLPLCCWSEEGISKISSAIGKPLSVDPLTANCSRLSFARVCIQISPSSSLPNIIPISLNGKEVLQEVIYEWRPSSCSTCNSFSHSSASCPKAASLLSTSNPSSTKSVIPVSKVYKPISSASPPLPSSSHPFFFNPSPGFL